MVTRSTRSDVRYLAIDIGGTKVEAALVDERGELAPESRHRAATGPDTDHAHLRAVLVDVISAARQTLPDGSTLVGVGAGSAGPIDHRSGAISPLNMPALSGFPLHSTIRDLVDDDVPVEVGLDGLCIALAEWRWGAGQGCDNMLSMVVSTGIGAGLIVDGRPLLGSDGNAGHLGQLRVSAEVDADPTTGTLEKTASGPATVSWARAQGWQGTTGEELAASARAGDPIARGAIGRSAEAVGDALAGTGALLGIERAIIGGGFALNAPDYLQIVRERAHRVAVLPAAKRLDVLAPALGSSAPLVGAALLVSAESVA